MGRRSGIERLDAIPAAIERGNEFQSRIAEAGGDAVRCADLMAEAIEMDREARMLEPVGRDGRATFSMERLTACQCMSAAREAYLRARGSNYGELR
jgi:hypothetical protein